MPSTLATSCRACLKESFEDYFEMNKQCDFTKDDLNFCDIFNLCTHLSAQTTDGLPQRICTLCAQDLQQSYAFLQRSATSDKILKSLKEETNQGTDESHDFNKDPLENVTDNEDDEVN